MSPLVLSLLLTLSRPQRTPPGPLVHRVAHRVIPCDLGLLVKRRDRLTRIVLATDDDDPALTWLVPHLRRALDEVDRCREALRTPDLGV